LAGTVAVTLVALTNVVVSAVEPHITVDPLTNPVPVTVIVKVAPPLVADDGLRLVIVGAAVTLNAEFGEVPPSGFTTETLNEPELTTWVAVTAAVSLVALTNVVVKAVEPQYTVAPVTKAEPFTVIVNAEAVATVVAGDSELIFGPVIVTVDPAEVTEPEFTTVTEAVPVVAIRLEGTVAVMDVAVPAVTVRAVLPQLTPDPAVNTPPPLVVPGMKLVPVTVML